MKRLRSILQPQRTIATVLAMVWLPYAGTRCIESPVGPRGSAGSVDFGHHESHPSSSGHHDSSTGHHDHDTHGIGGNARASQPIKGDVHTSADAGRHEGQPPGDTCCTQTGKGSVIPSTPAGSEPPRAVAVMGLYRAARPQRADHPDQRTLRPVAHSPPIYLRNATLLI